VIALAALVLVMAACGSSDSSSEAAYVEIVFDGTGCRLSQESVPAGDQAFVLTNTSDIGLSMSEVYVNNLHDHTFQELVDIQTEAGGPGTYFDEPDWEVPEGKAKREPTSFAAPPDVELEANQLIGMWTLTSGTDVVLLGTWTPPRLWLCAPLEVTS
jgi:hypothetical protein